MKNIIETKTISVVTIRAGVELETGIATDPMNNSKETMVII